MSIDNLYQQKWQKFMTRIWPFRFIPFVDFVLASGSLATGNPRTQRAEQSSHDGNPRTQRAEQSSHDGNPRTQRAEQSSHDGNIREESDFDVIVGVRQGRIFTVRFLCWTIFGLLGWRAKHPAYKSDGSNRSYTTYTSYKDKICFNHFVTPNAYRLSPPYNEYWKKLYMSLVPVCGSPEAIQKFYDANSDWTGSVRNSPPKGPFGPRLRAGAVSNGMAWLLSGSFGDWLEKILKKIQIWKMKNSRNPKNEHKPRIVVTDDELQFHPNTERELKR